MSKKLEEIDTRFAHIEVNGRYFQELNEAGDDWDEAKTQAAVMADVPELRPAEKKAGWFAKLFGG